MLLAAVVSKEILYRVTKKIGLSLAGVSPVGEKSNSSVLIANAYHHRSDVWASVVALAGIGGSYLGFRWGDGVMGRFPLCDPLGGVAVGVLIAKTGLDLLSGNYYNLMDRQDLDENKLMANHCGR